MTQYTVSTALQLKYEQYLSGAKKVAAVTKDMGDKAERVTKENVLLGQGLQLVGAIGAVALGKKMVTAASNLNESLSKTNVVFRQNSAAVVAWSKTSATAMGLSQQKAVEAAATYGNLFTAMGIGTDTSAKMSTQLVQLAGDLASFNNVDPAAALDALRSGLVGETEPLRQFGVNLNDADLRQKALQLGLVKTTKEVLPASARAQAAYALILDQTKTAQGDFARTADGLANSQRILSAEWENAQASLGQALLPAVQTGVHLLNAFLSVFNALPAPVRSVAVASGALAAGLLLLAPRLVATKAALSTMGVTGEKASKGLGKATTAVLAIAAAGVLMKQFDDQSVNAGKGVNELADALERTARSGKIDDQLGFSNAARGAQSFTDALDLAANNNIGDQFAQWAGGITGLGSSLDDAKQSVSQVDAALAQMVSGGHGSDAAAAFQAISNAWVASGHDASQLTALLPQYRDAMAGASTATTSLTTSTNDAAASVQSLKDKIDGLRGTQMSADEATASLEAAIDGATKAAKENGRTLDEHTDKGRANGQALRDIATAALDGVESWNANGESARKVAAHTQEARDAFIKTAVQMGATKKEANRLADAYGLIPKNVRTAVSVNITSASTAIDKIKAQWAETVSYINSHPAMAAAHYGLTSMPTTTKKKKAGGGQVDGPGSGTSDDVPIWASNGEWVIRSASAAQYGPAAMASVNAGTATINGYATGGKVKKRTVSSRVAGHVGSRAFDFGDRSQIADASNVPLLGSFDFTAYGQAVQRATSATQALFDARVKVNEASTPQEEAQAQRDLAAATLEVANAEKAKAAAKPTAGNIEATFSRRAQKLDRFRRNLKTLAQRGLSPVILKEILDAGIDSGYDMAAAIVGDPTMIPSLNRTQAAITSDANSIAGMFGGVDRASTVSSLGGGSSSSGSVSSSSSGSVSSSASGSLMVTFKDASKPIVLKMDSKVVWKGLLDLKRGNGGVDLGLK